jgi:nucleoside-diphosphate-sugar epimerase
VRVLVTGLTGFLGSHLGRALVARGDEVCAIVRPGADPWRIADYRARVRVIEGDLREPASYARPLAELRPERAFHLAWSVVPGRFWTSPENLDCVAMTLHLARQLANAGCRKLVAGGTCAEYAWEHGVLREDETPLGGESLYAVAKNATREILEAFGRESGLGVAWARFFFPFGPGEAEPRLIPSVSRALLRGERPRCTHGEQRRDFLYAPDCAAALVAIADAPLTGPVNVGSGVATRIRDVVETLAALAGRSPADVDFGALPAPPGEPPLVVADVRRLASTGFAPEHSLRAALAETLEWWRKRA